MKGTQGTASSLRVIRLAQVRFQVSDEVEDKKALLNRIFNKKCSFMNVGLVTLCLIFHWADFLSGGW